MHQSETPSSSDSKNRGIGRGMDRLSSSYDLLTKLLSLGKVRAYQKKAIGLVEGADRIAIIGGGTGKIINDVQRAFPESKIHFIELSRSMIENARKIHTPNVTFTHGSEQDLFGSYDLVILPFILNCLNHNELIDLISRIKQNLSLSGQILIVDFDPSRKSPLLKLYLKILYFGFRAFVPISARKLNNYLETIKELGFKETKNISSSGSWYHCSLQTQNKKEQARE